MKKIVLLLTVMLLTFAGSAAQSEVVADSNSANTQSVQTEMKNSDRSIPIAASENYGQDILVQLVAISAPFICAILIVFLVVSYKSKERKNRYELMAKAIEAGRDLPDHFFDNPKKEKQNTGVVMTCVGIGLLLTLYFWSDMRQLAAIGFVPLFVGIGQFTAWKLKQRNTVTPHDEHEQN